VVAVVVSYNRADLLRQCLTAVDAQSRPVDAVVVVDNASTDGSADLVADEFPKADVVRLTTNTGGAGGFAVGMAHALDRHGADLVWVMDDDTVPSETALETLVAAEQRYPDTLDLVASRVTWTDGRDQDRNIPRPVILARRRRRQAAAAVGGRPMRTACFVSLLVSAEAIRQHGLPSADFFIWNDDFEFTARILRRHPGIYLPLAKVVHKTRELGTRTADPGDRFYFEVRNKIWTFRDGQAFGFPEVLLRVAIASVNWSRFFLHSSQRAVLRTAFLRGLSDGVRTRPRPNREVLLEAGYELGAGW
jgi:rhamnopyranosyl-N-acetylglucosaminyl-diphospho-decaprenol beta-1,3/1,4-galactofuranosyltransferase